jgi:hypothetical protein
MSLWDQPVKLSASKGFPIFPAKMFQLIGREDAWRVVIDWIDAVFGC